MKKNISPLVAGIVIIAALIVVVGVYMVLMNPQKRFDNQMKYMSEPIPETEAPAPEH